MATDLIPVTATAELVKQASCVCVRCAKPIVAGEEILAETISYKAVGWSHLKCAAKVNAAAAAWLKSPELSASAVEALSSAVVPKLAKTAAAAAAPEIEKLIVREFDKAVDAEVKKRQPTVVRVPHKADRKVEGVCHRSFADAMAILGCGLNLYLPGPRGCGKTAMVGQIAKALGVPYYPVSCAGFTGPSDLIGTQFQNVVKGKVEFLPSALLTAFEHGGLVLLDEIDACDPSALIALNAIAEATTKEVLIPRDPRAKPIVRNEMFFLGAAANTVGLGATQEFSARMKQDESLLSRFVFVKMDYDPAIDAAACPQHEVRDHFVAYRQPFRDARITQPFPDTRFLYAASVLHQAGASIQWIEKIFFNAMPPALMDRLPKPPVYKHMWDFATPPTIVTEEARKAVRSTMAGKRGK